MCLVSRNATQNVPDYQPLHWYQHFSAVHSCSQRVWNTFFIKFEK